MSILAGGRAAKLGNRYEGRWVAYQLIRLLAGELSAVQLEAIGDDEQGVDVWVTYPTGTREAYQCKRKNRSIGKWSIGELGRQSVLKNLADQLRRGDAVRFTFVSAHPAPEVCELADSARASGGDQEMFFQSTLGVKAHADNLRQFCQFVGADPDQACGRRDAFDLLCRTHTHLFEDSRDGDALLRSLARCHVGGDAAAVVETLANFAQERLGHPILIDELRRHLFERQFRLVDIAGVPNIGARLDRLRSEFRDSLRHGLALAAPIPRPETDTILRLVNDPTKRLVVVHGRAGDGKSTVLLQLTERLEEAQIPFLPLRLDRRPPAVSAEQYGTEQCNLPASPAVVLRSVYTGKTAVLILDQLDAIRWTSAHGAARWEACRELIDEALGFSNLVVVVACRSFDLRDDQQIRAWHTERKGDEIVVGELPDATVATAMKVAGSNYEALTGRQKQLLRSPLLLSLWLQTRHSGHTGTGWNTQTDLMRQFWKSRYEELERLAVPAEECRSAVDTLVNGMDRRGELSVAVQSLDRYSKAAAALKSLGIIFESDHRLLFAHQSYFEYLLATRLSEQVAAGEQTVVGWLLAGDQSLLRREQLRLLLTLLRDDSPREFMRAVHDIIHTVGIRFHLKHLVLGVVGDVPHPSPPEIDLACALATSTQWREHVFDLVLTRHPGWFDAIDGRGLLADWLAAPEESLSDQTRRLCLGVAAQRGDQVAALLAPFVVRPDPWPRRVVEVLRFNSETDSDALFAIRLSLIRAGHYHERFLTADRLADRFPSRCVDLLEAFFEAHPLASDTNRPLGQCAGVPYWIEQHEVDPLERVANTIPEQFWGRLVPHVIRVSERTRDDRSSSAEMSPFYRDCTWSDEHRLNQYEPRVEVLQFIARAGSVLITREPEMFRSTFREWVNHPALSVQYTVSLAFAEAGLEGADIAISWLCDEPTRFSVADNRGRLCGIARRILAKHAAHCTEETYRRLERQILQYRGPGEWVSIKYQIACIRNGWKLEPNWIGLAQHALLPSLPVSRLSDTARSEMGVLERKFKRPADDFLPHRLGRMRSLVSPVPHERAIAMTDEGWLGIINSVTSSDGRWRHRDVGEDHFTESTPEAFSDQLGQQAQMNPRRFAALALRIAPSADPAYLSAIVFRIGAASPPNQEITNWFPASDNQIVSVVEYVGYRLNFELARGVCWLIQNRSDAIWTSASRDILQQYAMNHPNPAEEEWGSTRDDEQELYRGGFNCVRGSALYAIRSLLFKHIDLLSEFLPAIRHAVSDPSPIVRVAAVAVCLPMLNTNRDLAVELFLQACETDDLILATHTVNEFLAHTLATHQHQLEPLLERMATSACNSVATRGATWLAVNWLHDRNQRPVLDQCRHGSHAQRRGVAAAGAHNIKDRRLAAGCSELLIDLIDDSDQGVQEALAEFLRNPKALDNPEVVCVARRFIAGPGLVRKPIWLMEALVRRADSLIPVADLIFAVSERLTGNMTLILSDQSSRHRHEFYRFVPVVLRLYEQAEQVKDRELRCRCLDWWDKLLEARVWGVMEATGRLDSGL